MGKGILMIIAGVLCIWAVAEMSSKDKYVMRDGCLYHFTQEYNGVSVDGNYTKVTCDPLEFEKYHIEK